MTKRKPLYQLLIEEHHMIRHMDLLLHQNCDGEKEITDTDQRHWRFKEGGCRGVLDGETKSGGRLD